MGGWPGGRVEPTVIIGLVSVQVELKLDLPTGTELRKNTSCYLGKTVVKQTWHCLKNIFNNFDLFLKCS